MHIRINDFAGTFPKMHPTKLPNYAAQDCLNSMVDYGVLTPSTQATQLNQSGVSKYNGFMSAIFFEHEGITYKKFDNALVRYAFSPVHDAYRLYWTTEDSMKQVKFVDWDITGVAGSYRLVTDGYEYIAGMPAPNVEYASVTGITTPNINPPAEDKFDDEGALIPPPPPVYPNLSDAAINQAFKVNNEKNNASGIPKTEDKINDAVTSIISGLPEHAEARVYAFTYVNRFGDESAPGVLNRVIYLTKGDNPTITIPYTTGIRQQLMLDYGINGIRLYRSVTNSAGEAQFLFVRQYNLTLTGNNIVIHDDMPYGSPKIGEPLVTMNYDPPRLGMKGLGVTNAGVGYGYIDRTICLSEPYTLYAFPRFYELSSQHTIMGMGHYDDTIVVATKGNPMLVGGSDPESMSVLSLPLYEGCVSPRSMVNLNHGCMYASDNGLVLVTTNSANLFTEGAISTDDWQRINPSSIHATAYKNGYLFFWSSGSRKGSGYIDLNETRKGVMWFDDYALNTFLNGNLVQMVTRPSGTLSYHSTFNPEFGEPFTGKTLKWKSKTFNLSTPKRMLAGQVLADSYPVGAITFRVYANGVLLHESAVRDSRPFRVANHSAKYDYVIEVESSVPIRELVLGETMRDTIA